LRVTKAVISYSITFYDDDETLALSPVSYTITSNEITLPTPVKSGYNFFGWYEDPLFGGSPVTIIPAGSIGNKVFYAKFEETSFTPVTVTYNFNGGIMTSDNLKTEVTNTYIVATRYSTAGDSAGNRITVGTARGGLYWYVIALKSTGVSGVYQVLGKGTGYTHAEANLYLSYHDSINSSYKTLMQSIYSQSTTNSLIVIEWLPSAVTADTEIPIYFLNDGPQSTTLTKNYSVSTDLITPIKPGSTFGGWYTNPELTGTAVTQLEGLPSTVTLYAKWN